MKYIFFGTPEFSAEILGALVRAGMPPVALVTNPDRPRGRRKVMSPPPTKELAFGLGAGIAVLQPERLDADFIREIRAFGAECGVLAAYGTIVPKEVIAAFPKGIVVVHPSLLPRYRGATPIQSAIVAGDTETGTTLFLMDERVDHGPVIASATELIADTDTYMTLAKRLAGLSAELLIDVLPKYCAGEVAPRAQDELQATYTKKLVSADGFVDLEKTAPEVIWRMVRALNPEPGVFTVKDDKRVKLLEADFADGKLVIRTFQFEGGLPRTDGFGF